jgi:transposase
MGELVRITETERIKSQFRRTSSRRVWADIDLATYRRLEAIQESGESMSHLIHDIIASFDRNYHADRAEGIS